MYFIEKFFNTLSLYHHERIFKYLKKLNIKILIDVGAHKGEFLNSVIKLKTVDNFYAFEPQKVIYNHLKTKFFDKKNVILYNKAVDSEISKKKIFINNFSMTSTMSKYNENSFYLKFKNFLLGAKKNFIEEYSVETTTIDAIFENIDLRNSVLKIDVEGFEYNVVKGAEQKLSEISMVLIENQFGNHYINSKFSDIKKFLLTKNFIETKKFVFPTLHYQDILFRKKAN